MLRMPESDVDIRERSPLELAFLGDGVYSLLVRARLVARGRAPAGALHGKTARIVSAEAQAAALAALATHLTDEEQALVRRAQNAAPKQQGKSHTHAQYRDATALEALFGWLYAKGDGARIGALFDAVWQWYEAQPPG